MLIRKLISAFLIIIYFSLSLKDFTPLFFYKINLNYIIKNLCEEKDEVENLCMGHCYLNKKVKQATDETPNNTTPRTVVKILESHFISEMNLGINFQFNSEKKKFPQIRYVILSNNIKPLFPPPKNIFSHS